MALSADSWNSYTKYFYVEKTTLLELALDSNEKENRSKKDMKHKPSWGEKEKKTLSIRPCFALEFGLLPGNCRRLSQTIMKLSLADINGKMGPGGRD